MRAGPGQVLDPLEPCQLCALYFVVDVPLVPLFGLGFDSLAELMLLLLPTEP
jgi:hypothetical protein